MDYHNETKIKFLYVLGLVFSVVLLLYVAINIYLSDYFTAAFEAAFSFMLIYGVYHLYRTGETKQGIFIGIFVLCMMSLNNFMRGGFANTGVLWLYMLPTISFFLIGAKKGSILMASMIGLYILISLFHLLGYYELPYDDFTISMILLTLSVTSFLIYIYQITIERRESVLSNTLRQNELLTRVVSGGNDSEHLENVYEDSLVGLNIITGIDAIGLSIINTDTGKIESTYTRRLSGKMVDVLEDIDFGIDPYISLLQMEEITIPYTDHDVRPEQGWATLVRITNNEKVIGVIGLFTKSKFTFSEESRKYLDSLVDELSSIISRQQAEVRTQNALEDIEKKNTELEKVNKAMVNRELKMIELKKENALLKKALNPKDTKQTLS